ncbi:sigma-54 interaction domain-containing protein [Ammoniphilus sp. 3BR4]|uniref:sigma-54 interaction domain-containing protein n=1 Tax=Ammoniphilus sp. 3BR4 TaxID=3158265 RepID=UPI003466C298
MDQNPNLLAKRLHIYEQVLNRMNEGVHVIDEHGQTIVYNPKMTEIESMKAQDVLNKNLLDVFHFPDKQESTLLLALHEGKSTLNVKQTYFNGKGKEITTINNTYPIFDGDQIIGAIEFASDVTKMERIIRQKIEKGHTRYTFDSIIGRSHAIMEVIHNAKRAARTSSSVLIIGETGTGKELFAQSIHHASGRSSEPFVSQNCAALPDSLIEGILFGTAKGAFTGAIERAGLFEQAEGGTLFLDEINSLNLPLQAKLLRALQEKSIRRIGDSKDKEMDVRIIAAINEDPIEAIANNHIRKDLYYRLGVVTLFIPSLRERKEDIPLLVHSFIHKYNQLFGMQVAGVSQEVHQYFMEYDWPGNIRELQHFIEGAMNLMGDEEEILLDHLPTHHLSRKAQAVLHPASSGSPDASQHGLDGHPALLKDQIKGFESDYIHKMIEKNGGNISRAAREMGISRQSLQYRLRRLKAQSISSDA